MGPLQNAVFFATGPPTTFLSLLHRSHCDKLSGPPAQVPRSRWKCALKPQKGPAKKPRTLSPIPRIQQEFQRGLTIFREDMVRFRQRLLQMARREGDKMGNGRASNQVVPDNGVATEAPRENHGELTKDESESQPEVFQAYRPRSVTGQAVAEGFSTFRGTVTRTFDVTLLNVREALRTAANVLMSVAVKVVPGLPAADRGRTSSGWRLLGSLQWQAPSELLGRTGEMHVNLRNVISKARKQRRNFVKNRTKEDKILRVLGASATSAGSLFGGMRDAVIGLATVYKGRLEGGGGKQIDSYRAGRKSDQKSLISPSLQSSEQKSMARPSPRSSGRKSLTRPGSQSFEQKSLTRLGPRSSEQKSLTGPSPTRESKLRANTFYNPAKMTGLEWMVRGQKVGKSGGALVAAGVITVFGGWIGGALSLPAIASCSAIVATSAAVVSGRIDAITPPSRRNRKVYVNPLENSQKRKNYNYVPRSTSRLAPTSLKQDTVLKENKEVGERKQETLTGAGHSIEKEEDRWSMDESMNESMETTAYSVGPVKPWLVSVPLFGDVLKMLDSVAFVLERGLKSLFRALGIPMKNSRVEGGWVMLNTLHANRYTD